MNVNKIRRDFPLLNQKKAPIYFDSACTTLRPTAVLEKMKEYYELYPGCGGRSHHKIGERVTEEVLKARIAVAKFFNAKDEGEIVFTRNTTEGINFVANSLKWNGGDKVLCSDKEHNSNLVPWLLAKQRGILKHEIFKFGDLCDFSKKIKGARLVSIAHSSNIDGTSQDVKEMIKIAHENNALVMLDAAQSAPHKEIDIRKLDCDFLVCSGHKMLGPSGIGVLYGKMDLLKQLNQFIVGGETVTNTNYTSFEQEKVPERFEAGLQNYGGIVGLAEAMNYLKKIGLTEIEKHEQKLNARLSEGLIELGADIIGPSDSKLRGGIVSFNIGKMNPHDISLMLDSYNIMIRSGMHCAHSWFNSRGIRGSSRASLYLYNTADEVDFMLDKMKDIAKLA